MKEVHEYIRILLHNLSLSVDGTDCFQQKERPQTSSRKLRIVQRPTLLPHFLKNAKPGNIPGTADGEGESPEGWERGKPTGGRQASIPGGSQLAEGGANKKKNKIPAGRGAPSSGSCCPPAARPRRTEPARARGPAPRMSEVNQGGSGHLCYHSLVRLLANQSSWQCKRQEKCSGQ